MSRRAFLQGAVVAMLPAAALAVPLPHPDAELLDVCQQLQAQQAEWQRLWAAIPDGPDDTEETALWEDYDLHVWPGTHLGSLRRPGPDLLPLIIATKAHTVEGLRAKAACLAAAEHASAWTGNCRDDICELQHRFLVEVAGDAFVPLGEDHPDWKARS